MSGAIFEENVSLAPLTTLKVGGPARYFAQPTSVDELKATLAEAHDRGLAIFILGGGSNVVVSDSGFDGLVIRPAFVGVQFEVEDGKMRVSAGAGENWDTFVESCVKMELAGLEALSGIPGLVGGTPIQNVGAYGQEVSETIVSVECLNRGSGAIEIFSNADCRFAYRQSIFNSTHRDRYVILKVNFELTRNGKPKVAYRDLIERFDGRDPSLADVRAAVLEIRSSKSMVIDASDPNSRSAGSFFKNPIVEQEMYDHIAAEFDNVPRFPAGRDHVKIPAAWLIENAGFQKGYRMGGAGISARHPLAIINADGATAAEIIALKDAIQQAVSERFSIDLTPEPTFVGF